VRIGIDAKTLTLYAGGIGRYATELVPALVATAGTDDTVVLFDAPQRTADAAVVDELHPVRARSSVVRSLLTLPQAVRQSTIELFHGLDHVGMPSRRRVPGVLTVHDLLPLQYPQWFSLKHRLVVRTLLPRAIRSAERIIVPSRDVAEAVQRRFPTATGRIRCVPEGCAPAFHEPGNPLEDARLLEEMGVTPPYLLCVSTIEPRKNHPLLVRAFAGARASRRLDPRTQLVLAGRVGWGSGPLRRALADRRLGDRVRLTGWISERRLAALYRGALAAVCPSRAEGFGLPLTEAMAAGTPVVRSAIPSFDEIGGKATLRLPAWDLKAWSDGLARIAGDAALRQRLAEAGKRRARAFTWDRAARRTWRVYAELLT
jgi:glycosyltransferase involved in cell wall biosynthesis